MSCGGGHLWYYCSNAYILSLCWQFGRRFFMDRCLRNQSLKPIPETHPDSTSGTICRWSCRTSDISWHKRGWNPDLDPAMGWWPQTVLWQHPAVFLLDSFTSSFLSSEKSNHSKSQDNRRTAYKKRIERRRATAWQRQTSADTFGEDMSARMRQTEKRDVLERHGAVSRHEAPFAGVLSASTAWWIHLPRRCPRSCHLQHPLWQKMRNVCRVGWNAAIPYGNAHNAGKSQRVRSGFLLASHVARVAKFSAAWLFSCLPFGIFFLDYIQTETARQESRAAAIWTKAASN